MVPQPRSLVLAEAADVVGTSAAQPVSLARRAAA
jgi:hypothetical protein